MTDTNEDLTVQDILDAAADNPYHALLHVWREILRPSRVMRAQRPTPQWANRIVTSYAGISFADVTDFSNSYYDKIDEMLRILEFEIDSDPECLNVIDPEEDKAQNSHHYINVLTLWQLAVLQWELDWDNEDAFAAVDLAAISEVHKMFFDRSGLIELLEQIQFEWTDADRDHLLAQLEEARNAANPRGADE